MDLTGETHQGVFDMAFFNIIPNLVIMAPKDFKELKQMMEYAISLKKPVVIRYPRGGESKVKFEKENQIKFGEPEKLKDGDDLTIVAIGKMVSKSMEIANELEKQNINADVINARFLKPLDKEMIVDSINKTKFVITIEDGTLIGGLASCIEELIITEKIKNIKFKKFGYPDMFIKQGTVEELEKIYGLNNGNIINYIKENISIKEKIIDISNLRKIAKKV